MKLHLLLSSLTGLSSALGIKGIENVSTSQASQSFSANQDLVVNTSDPFQSSAEVYLNQTSYQTLKQDWNYFLILKTINNFKIIGQKLPDSWYENMSQIIALETTKAKIDQVMNPKGVIIPFQYINISSQLILRTIYSQ